MSVTKCLAEKPPMSFAKSSQTQCAATSVGRRKAPCQILFLDADRVGFGVSDFSRVSWMSICSMRLRPPMRDFILARASAAIDPRSSRSVGFWAKSMARAAKLAVLAAAYAGVRPRASRNSGSAPASISFLATIWLVFEETCPRLERR